MVIGIGLGIFGNLVFVLIGSSQEKFNLMLGVEGNLIMIIVKDEEGNVMGERLFLKGISDVIIEQYIFEIFVNYINQVKQGIGVVFGNGLGIFGNMVFVQIDG